MTATHLYSHPQDIFHLYYNDETFNLEVSEGSREAIVPMNADGLIGTGIKMIALGHEMTQAGVVADISLTLTDVTDEFNARNLIQGVEELIKTYPYDPRSADQLDELAILINDLRDKLTTEKPRQHNVAARRAVAPKSVE